MMAMTDSALIVQLDRRFARKIHHDATGCWLWTGMRDENGYGIYSKGPRRYAHRVAYMDLIGPIPRTLSLDHLCRNRACVNPAHLEPVTHAENVARGREATKTICCNGHPYDEVNTYVRPGDGRRACRSCNRERQRRWNARYGSGEPTPT